ncbi:hypothetical protein ACHAXR_008199 [Thalassiosira sp. AJA248-18]
MTEQQSQIITSVLYVRRQDAKAVKLRLERASLLDKQFRMVPVANTNNNNGSDDAPAYDVSVRQNSDNDPSSPPDVKNCIAVPVTAECVQRLHANYDHDRNTTDDNTATMKMMCANDSMLAEEPSVDEHLSSSKGCSSSPVLDNDHDDICSWLSSSVDIVGFGRHKCPYSSSMLGNNNKSRRSRAAASTREKEKGAYEDGSSPLTSNPSCCNNESNSPLTNVQYALIDTLNSWLDNHENESVSPHVNNGTIETLVRELSSQACPKKLEIIGDDRTLVVPRWSLFVNNCHQSYTSTQEGRVDSSNNSGIPKKESSEFRELLDSVIIRSKGEVVGNESKLSMSNIEGQSQTDDEYSAIYQTIQSQLWSNLANIYNSPRVVRRGDIDPESGVRESGHRILWPVLPSPPPANGSTIIINGKCNHGFLPTTTGPDSPGWITVTEHKIRQSFDLTRVMFSRGNVTEKKRFGMSLVRPGECVLDMYAGIGYYTLPALIHGRARHVTACEWNTHALHALRYNLRANGVEDRTTVLEGDCRVSLKRLIEKYSSDNGGDEIESNAEIKEFDRISLGLLPSSEGGWAIAVSCLSQTSGGWLHVHGNVPTAERQNWCHWLCRSLASIAADQQKQGDKRNLNDWIAVCIHVEKVKSFAPKVDHVVADVFLGPRDSPKMSSLKERGFCSTGVIDSLGRFTATPHGVSPPSCALNEEGILHQNWLR